jgi:plasmid maintenance system antidote protein VapI
MVRYFSEDDLIEDLKEEVSQSTQTAVADKYGISRSNLNEILSGRQGVSRRVAEILGYQREMVFRKIA